MCLIIGNIGLDAASSLGLGDADLAGVAVEFGMSSPIPLLFFALAFTCGLMNGFIVSRATGLSAVVTLNMIHIARGFILIYSLRWPVFRFPTPHWFRGWGSMGLLPWPLIVFIGVLLVFHFILAYAAGGHHVHPTSGNVQATRVRGTPVDILCRLPLLTRMRSRRRGMLGSSSGIG